MTMLRRTIFAEVTQLGEREVTIRMSTGGRARDGHILPPDCCDLTDYRLNPIVLWSHDPKEPVGNNEDVAADADGINARCLFADAGISPTADRICGLVKTGVIRALSIGFVITEGTPIDASRPKAGIRATKWELLECSFVSIPSDTGTKVTGRAAETEESTMSDERVALRRQLLVVDDTGLKLRGLYDVAQLCYLVQQLGYAQDSAAWEKSLEGDDSQVPAMLGDCLQQLGAALIAMTKEEVSELLANALGAAAIDDEKMDGERAYIEQAPTPFARSWRTALVHVRAGKAISAASAAKLSDAAGHLDRAAKAATDAAGSVGDATGHQEAIGDAHAAAQTAHGKAGDAIEAAAGSDPAGAAAALAKVWKQHTTIGKHLAAIGERCASMGDAAADAAGSIAGAQRGMRAAVRCMGVLFDDDPDDDAENLNGGRSADFDFRRRQVALLDLAGR